MVMQISRDEYDVDVELYRHVTIVLNDRKCIEVLKSIVRDYIKAYKAGEWEVKDVDIYNIIVNASAQVVKRSGSEWNETMSIHVDISDGGGA